MSTDRDELHPEEEDGMGFSGLLPSQRDREQEALENQITSLRSQLAESKEALDNLTALYIEAKRERDNYAANAQMKTREAIENLWKYQECEKELDEAQRKLKVATEALESYSSCSDGCTCGDGWNHDVAKAALSEIQKEE